MKNIKFNIKICPLCHQNMKLIFIGTTAQYYCPTSIKEDSLLFDKCKHLWSHYIVGSDPVIQKVYLDKYYIESCNGISKIYSVSPSNVIYKSQSVGWTSMEPEPKTFIMQIPIINIDDPNKIIKKLTTLIPFI